MHNPVDACSGFDVSVVGLGAMGTIMAQSMGYGDQDIAAVTQAFATGAR
ncbi:hypothetical protein [Pseudomonas putida]|uniref:Uncharacterized protein n=1 Tax=Pseudomonas putida TaxID=303 RepID=A0A6I7ESF3_PSEPU|nr:hypothetical protein [Pseudomonas putida]QHW08407.1 hypothetical protein C2H86_28615 [Pseudomonas putida]